MLDNHKINLIREFNRNYVIALGVLNRQIFATDLSWPEGRILEEISLQQTITPSQIARKLNVDKGYVSRIITSLTKKSLVKKIPNENDHRSIKILLTKSGEQAYQVIDSRSNAQINHLLGNLSPQEQAEFFENINHARQLLFRKDEAK